MIGSASAPASSGNLGPGFDVLALALALAGSGLAVDIADGAAPGGGAVLEGAQMAAVLGVPIGPRLGIIPSREVGRGDTGAAETAPVDAASVDAELVTPERGPEPRSRMSLAILKRLTAISLSAPWASTIASWVPRASNLFGAVMKGIFV